MKQTIIFIFTIFITIFFGLFVECKDNTSNTEEVKVNFNFNYNREGNTRSESYDAFCNYILPYINDGSILGEPVSIKFFELETGGFYTSIEKGNSVMLKIGKYSVIGNVGYMSIKDTIEVRAPYTNVSLLGTFTNYALIFSKKYFQCCYAYTAPKEYYFQEVSQIGDYWYVFVKTGPDDYYYEIMQDGEKSIFQPEENKYYYLDYNPIIFNTDMKNGFE